MAFVAKAVYNFSNTIILIDYIKNSVTLRRLCGWESRRDIPSESTFSRAFDEFAHGELPQCSNGNFFTTTEKEYLQQIPLETIKHTRTIIFEYIEDSTRKNENMGEGDVLLGRIYLFVCIFSILIFSNTPEISLDLNNDFTVNQLL